MCRATGGSAVMFNQGSIANGSYSQTMTLHCPVVRENDASEIGTMSVHLIDANHGAGIRCSWYDVEAYGRSWWWSGYKTSLGGGSSNIGTLSWNRSTVRDRYAGFSHMVCTVPPRTSDGYSHVASYRIGE